jgi:hypothetical protein
MGDIALGSYTRGFIIDGSVYSGSYFDRLYIRARTTYNSATFEFQQTSGGYNGGELYEFDSWDVAPDFWGASGSTSPTLSMSWTTPESRSESADIRAVVREVGIQNIVTANPEEGGTVSISPDKIKWGSSNSIPVTLTANPYPGWRVKSVVFNTGLSRKTINVDGGDGEPYTYTGDVGKGAFYNSGSTFSGLELHHSVTFERVGVLVKASGDGDCTINGVENFEQTFSANSAYTLNIIPKSGYAIYQITSTLGDNTTFSEPELTHSVSAIAVSDITWSIICRKIVTVVPSVNMEVCGTISISPDRNPLIFFENELITVSFNELIRSTVLAFLDWGLWKNDIKHIITKDSSFSIRTFINEERETPNKMEIRCEVSPADGRILCTSSGVILASSKTRGVLSRSPS